MSMAGKIAACSPFKCSAQIAAGLFMFGVNGVAGNEDGGAVDGCE
jgi:hypothetical protein